MPTHTAYEDSRLALWLRVRQFAVPPSMIETATARRLTGDWAGACAAAGVDVDLDLRSVARAHGRELTARLRADLRHLAPDLLRWHMPRIAPRGLLRPGLTIALARYDPGGRDGPPVRLVVRTPPARADAGQRISLALWDGTRDEPAARLHPHPHPNPRFRLDLHRHLWDARRTGELRERSGAGLPPTGPDDEHLPDAVQSAAPGRGSAAPGQGFAAPGQGFAVNRWAAEASVLLRAEGRRSGPFTVRAGARRLFLELDADTGGGPPVLREAVLSPRDDVSTFPVLPDAATWVLPDLELIRSGSADPDRLHPLVVPELLPGHPPATGPKSVPDEAGRPRVVECRGARHRIGLVDGVLVPLDHEAAEIRREELLVALTGTPLPCLRAIDEAHRRPDCLTGVRERLDHGDIAGALAVVEGLLGPGAQLREGALRDELEAAAERRIAYGLFRAGLAGAAPRRSLPGTRRRRPRGRHRPASSV